MIGLQWTALELRAGTRWTTWLGAAVLVVGAALLIKLAVEQGWLGPTARLALGIAAGAGLVGAGWRAARAKMRVLAHGLFGAGLGVVYISLYVASVTHALLAPELAFGAMVTVTAVGTVLAIAQDSQALAVLAWLGGLATPLIVPEIGSRDVSCAYVLVLAIAGTATAAARDWTLLAIVSVAGTHLALGTSMLHPQRGDGVAGLAWFGVAHAAVVITPVAVAARRRTLEPIWSGLCAVSAMTFVGAAITVASGAPLGPCVLGLALGHSVLALIVRRVTTDDTSRFAYSAIAIALITTTVPLVAPAAVTTIAWAVEAIAVLAGAREARDRQLRILALAVLGVAGLHGLGVASEARSLGIDRLAIVVVPPAAWLFARLHARRHGAVRGERWIGFIAGVGGTALALVAAHVEVLELLGPADGTSLVPAVWAVGSLVLGMVAGRSVLAHDAAAATAAIAAWLAFVAYRDGSAATHIALNVRCGAAVLGLIALARLERPSRWADLGVPAALIGLVVLVRAEVRDPTTLSITWSALAAVLLTAGFVAQRRALRLAGLGLLGLVTTKIMLVDLAGASSLMRVVSCLVLGTVLIGASYAYHRLTARD